MVFGFLVFLPRQILTFSNFNSTMQRTFMKKTAKDVSLVFNMFYLPSEANLLSKSSTISPLSPNYVTYCTLTLVHCFNRLHITHTFSLIRLSTCKKKK